MKTKVRNARRAHVAALQRLALAALVVFACVAGVAAQSAKHTAPVTIAPVAQAAAQGGKEVTVFGQKIHYVEAGSGPVVVLLHGLGGNTTNWAFTVPALAAKYRVIVPDQIGHGQSAKPFINYRIGTYTDFLDKFLDELKVERATLVGNSMGGWIAALYTLQKPARVERLVLVDAAGFKPPPDLDLAALSGLNPSTRAGMRQLASLVFHNKQLFTSDAAIDLMLAQRMSAGDGYTIQSLVESIHRGEDMLDGRLSAVKTPTLIVWGREDGLTPLAREGEKFKKEMPAAQLLVFDECGHVPQVEKAADFNAALLKFLAGATN
ncbi:MAG TPA: alpha/beta fold hydrolase [Pyrinomonadaceae bacterium]|nr:alpha/beta fold hydrolase [Pyrinomonadaceae bacterium]